MSKRIKEEALLDEIRTDAHPRHFWHAPAIKLCPLVLAQPDQVPVHRRLQGLANVHLLEPLAYVPFVDLMRRAYLLLTDSGGIQEEGPSLGKPVLVMREKTERPEAVEAGTVRLVGAMPDRILAETCCSWMIRKSTGAAPGFTTPTETGRPAGGS